MTEDVHLPLGADVLGGLNAAERRAFEDHIDGCSRCRTELAELVSVAALLGRVAAVPATWGAMTTGKANVDGATSIQAEELGQIRILGPDDAVIASVPM